tara:strand:- start:1001 stop:1282 length:282 start_codon:yes stop_codon:yes gene_type:complete
MTKEITDLRSIATAMTLTETNRKEILEEWEKLQVVVQLAEKELYNKNVDTVKQSLIQMKDLGQRVKMLETYTGSLKNRVEVLIQQRDPRHNQE